MSDPQHARTILHAGQPVSEAGAVVIMVHGRGATANSIMRLASLLDPESSLPVAWLAPQAEQNTWYPYPFSEPLARNEPHRSAALATVDGLITEALAQGLSSAQIGLVGFSQGACLALEHALIGEHQPGFIGALSGGVMAPLDTERSVEGDRTGMSIFIGCGDRDGHIALPYVERSAKLLRDAGATVDDRIYPGMDHTINDDEIGALRQQLARLVT